MPLQLVITMANIAEEIVETLAKITVSVREGCLSSEAMLDLCELTRRLGIGALLLDLNVSGYVENLFKSSRTYVRLLEAARKDPSIESYYLSKSRATPFLDAVCIDDHQAMKAIAELSTSHFHPDFEDEDDFCYFDFLISFFQKSANAQVLTSKLDRYTEALHGLLSFRHQACKALWARDEKEFWEAISFLLDERSEKDLVALQEQSLNPAYAHTEANVCIEGIALVKAGVVAGFTPESEYPLVPSIALEASLSDFPQEDPWLELGSLIL